MRPRVVLLAALSALVAGCGGSDGPADPFAYDASAPLRADVASGVSTGAVDVHRVTYAGDNGDRVPALFAVPKGQENGTCLIYQGGIGSRKEDAGSVWQPLAGIGAAAFTIDVRDQGERTSDPDAFKRTLSDPDRVVAWLRGTVVDLRRAIDFLATRPECDPARIAYAGLSQGGLIGILLSGADPRINGAVIMSVGGDWDTALQPGGLILPEVSADPEARADALEKLAPLSLRTWVARISPRPVLFVNGRRDPEVPLASARSLQAAAGQPKQSVVYDGGHNPFESPEALAAVAHFLRRTIVEGGA